MRYIDLVVSSVSYMYIRVASSFEELIILIDKSIYFAIREL